MSDEKKNLPDGAPSMDEPTEQEVTDFNVGVDSDAEAEGSSETPEDKLERIATEHDVAIDTDPEEVQAEAERSLDKDSTEDEDRDVRGGDTKEEEDPAWEPPD
ncbi:hypothetical protein GCM10009689_24250 [Brevibacterium antiquum]|uniref:hypothetical protein n=1 Tax=Brevibacterium antiquum TaxID=234835 RepID=UPI0018DF789C|nr:hypothetical protein [Brevibacterium antiquum]